MSFIVDPKSLSQSQIKADLEAFLASRPDAAKWTGFFNSSVGQTIVEMLSGVSTFMTYNNIVGRRETYLQYASNRSSGIGISQSLGYSVFRGKNQRLTLTVTPNTSTLLTKYTIIGSVKDLDLVLLEDTSVQNGIETTLEAVIGNLETESVTIDTETLATFRFESFPVSEDYRLLLNGTELDTSNRILDLENDKFAVITNAFDSVDVSYLNRETAAIQYTTGDTLSLEFISLKEISFVDTDVNYDFGVMSSFLRSSSYEPAETMDEIKVNAPLFHETQVLIRGRSDFLKTFKFLDTSFVDTNQRDVSAAVIELTYVKDDKSLLSLAQKTVFVDEIFKNILMGIPPPQIVDPIKVPLKLAITVVLKSAGDVTTAVETEIAKLENILEKQLNFQDIENSIEAYDFVKIARLLQSAPNWQASTQYESGSLILPTVGNDFIYKFTRIVYTSDGSEPTWPTTVGDTVIDNDIIWQAALIDLCDETLATWQASNEYLLDNLVLPSVPNGRMYKAVGYINRTNGINEVQKIDFSAVPDSGTWRIHFGAEETSDLAFNANSVDVEYALNALSSLSEVVVTGDYSLGFTLTFQGADGNKEQVQVDLTNVGTDEVQTISFSEVPNAGDFGLSFNGQDTAAIPYTAIAADVKAALEALPNIDQVAVTGNFASGFEVTFEGVNAKQDVALLELALLASSGADEIQRITFSAVPSSGTWRIHVGDEWTQDLAYNASNSTIQSELNGLNSLSGVSVSGSYAAGIDIEFSGDDGKQDQDLIVVDHAGQNSIQNIQFSIVPDFGEWRINYASEETTQLAFDASTTTIKAALEALPSINEVTVTGDYGQGFTFEFTGVDALKPHEELTVAYAGNNEIQTLDFSQVPVDGSFTLEFDAETTSSLDYNAGANDVKDALEALTNVDSVAVSGDFSSGFQVTFQGSLANQDVSLLAEGSNTLVYNSVAEQTRIVVSVGGSLVNGKTFLLYDQNGSVAFWFDTDNSGTPIPAGALAASRAVEITTVLGGDSAVVVANKLAAAIDADSEFSASFSGTQVDVTDAQAGLRTDATDINTTFTITTTVQGATAAVVLSPSVLVAGKTPSNQLTRVDVAVAVTTSQTQVGLLPAESLVDGVTPVTQSVSEVLAGQPELSNLTRTGSPVIVDIVETTKGQFPANNILEGVNPITISTSTLVDASDVEPVWPTTVGETIQDGDILWQAQKLIGTPDSWLPFTNYSLAEYVSPSSPVLDAENDNLMFQVIGFLGTSGASEPTWPTSLDNTLEDGNILWTTRDISVDPDQLAWNEYYEITQTLIIE